MILLNQQDRISGGGRAGKKKRGIKKGERKRKKEKKMPISPQRNTRKVSLGKISYNECPQITKMPKIQWLKHNESYYYYFLLISFQDSQTERWNTGAIRSASAQRILTQRLNPNCNTAGSFIQSCTSVFLHSYRYSI